MVEETGKTKLVPKSGDRVRIIKHEPAQRNYSCLADWGEEYAVGTEHLVDCLYGKEVNLKDDKAPCLLISEIEVIL